MHWIRLGRAINGVVREVSSRSVTSAGRARSSCRSEPTWPDFVGRLGNVLPIHTGDGSCRYTSRSPWAEDADFRRAGMSDRERGL